MTYIEPTQGTGRAFIARDLQGPVVMLNLLKFREIADYSGFEQLAPATPISGRAAYDIYMKHATPFVEAAGGDLVWMGTGGPNLIGPPDERWDLVLLVRHKNAATFLKFATDEAYLAGVGHRTAALEDSRLLPLVEP